jgi:hypothetical protein
MCHVLATDIIDIFILFGFVNCLAFGRLFICFHVLTGFGEVTSPSSSRPEGILLRQS